jgi:hypothetical protein
MTQLECKFAGQNADGIWMLIFSDSSAIEFPDEESFLQYCDEAYIDTVAVESLRRVTATRKFSNKSASVTFDINSIDGNLLKVD